MTAHRKRGAVAPALLAVLGILVMAGLLGWIFRDSLPFFGGAEPVEVSPEAAESAERKLQRLRENGEPARLSPVELSSLLRYRDTGWTGDLIAQPSVAMAGDTIRFSGTVATDRLPSHPELDRVRPLLPDSARVEVIGGIHAAEGRRVRADVRAVEFANIPIPEEYYPAILERLGRRPRPGLAPNALEVPLPAGVGSARVEDGYLLLTP